jgi:SNF2 family DNA or RNA helicase
MRPMWNHQVTALRMAENRENLGLLFEQGTGKTRTCIEILRRKYAKHGRVLKTLILAPIVVCENWKREFALYSKVNPNDIIVLTGSGASRVRQFINWAGEDLSRNKIFITNYHATGIGDLYNLMLKYNFEVVICDESQKLKNPSGKMAKAVAVIADKSKYSYILSGTPILNSPMDLFMQYRILDKGATFGKNFFSFRAAYCIDKNAGRQNTQGYFPKWEVREEMYPILQAKIQASSMRVLKKDCLDLPPLVRQEIEVELSPQQKRMYNEMKKEYLAFVDDLEKSDKPRTVTAQIAATKALRLQQIVSGYAQTEQDGVVKIEDVPRLSALSDLLEDLTLQHKIIVWAVFKENYRMIGELCDKLGIEWTELTGENTTRQKEENIDSFRKDPKIRVLVANPGAGGVGVNLVEASYAIYYSKGFSLEADLQSEARNHRGGSEIHEKITRIDLVARGTIDELINEALSKKQNVSEQILTWKDKI